MLDGSTAHIEFKKAILHANVRKDLYQMTGGVHTTLLEVSGHISGDLYIRQMSVIINLQLLKKVSKIYDSFFSRVKRPTNQSRSRGFSGVQISSWQQSL